MLVPAIDATTVVARMAGHDGGTPSATANGAPVRPGIRVLYGLGRVPISIPPDDPRLPGVWLDAAPLRLNTEPVADWVPRGSGHPEQRAAMLRWLTVQCGNYAPRLHRFIQAYLDFAMAATMRHRDVLSARLARFDGLYAVEDWLWSAPRPLPRAWTPDGVAWKPAAIAFWDGAALIALTESDLDPARLPVLFPDTLRWWDGESLPSSPFRRTLPQLVISST